VSGGVPQLRWHHFRQGLTLQMKRSDGNSPRGSSSGGGDRSRAPDDTRLAPTFGVIDDKLQRSAGNKIRLHGGGVTRRRATWHWFGAVRPPMERR
jgi:hypothetical protein